ncbi:hypothetical protein HII31_09039 [Pseudocercospora fuligena]|uniref:Uncharacterized protein n=1 Tax=Pseudocercospora fuligena TaxID=685502 RepID=A0A8H6VFK6_9PEZI|nr:hypothetical protein HII31_09039 [Pseudocercospora fuligena]
MKQDRASASIMSANRFKVGRNRARADESGLSDEVDHPSDDEQRSSDGRDLLSDDEEDQVPELSSSAPINATSASASTIPADRLSNEEEWQIAWDTFLGLNIVHTDPVDPLVGTLPRKHEHLSVGPPEHMVRLPDLPSGRASWMARDGVRYYVEVEMSDQTWNVRLHSSEPSSLQEIVADETDIDMMNVITRDQFLQATFPDGVEASGVVLPPISELPVNENQRPILAQRSNSNEFPTMPNTDQRLSSTPGIPGRVHGRNFNPYTNAFGGGMPIASTYAPGSQQAQATPLLQRNAMDHGNGQVSHTTTTGLQNGPRVGVFGNIITGPPGPAQYGSAGPAHYVQPMGAPYSETGRSQATNSTQMAHPRGGYQPQGASPAHNANGANGSNLESISSNYQGISWIGPYGNTITGPPPSFQQGAVNPAGSGRPADTGSADGNRAPRREARQPAHQQPNGGFAAPAFLPNPLYQSPSAPLHPNNVGRSGSGEVASRPAEVTRGGRGQPRGGINPSRGNARGGITKTRGRGSGSARRPNRISYADFKKERIQALADGTALQISETVQSVLDRAAPIQPNAPIPDWRQIGGTLRNNFGGRDLRGPLGSGNVAGAGAANGGGDAMGDNATEDGGGVDAGIGEDGDAPDPEEEEPSGDEQNAPGEEVSDDE